MTLVLKILKHSIQFRLQSISGLYLKNNNKPTKQTNDPAEKEILKNILIFLTYEVIKTTFFTAPFQSRNANPEGRNKLQNEKLKINLFQRRIKKTQKTLIHLIVEGKKGGENHNAKSLHERYST